MLIVELSVTPLDRTSGASEQIARVIEVIARSGLNFDIGPMGTAVEGELNDVMTLVHRCLEELRQDSNRFLFEIRGEFAEGRERRLEKRVEEVVEEVLSHETQSLSRNLSRGLVSEKDTVQ